MLGSFNKEAQEVWDFVRCMRKDGTYYGTSGKCRKGSEAGAVSAKATPKKIKAKVADKKPKKELSVAELEAQVAGLRKKVLSSGSEKDHDAYTKALDKLAEAKWLDKLKNLNAEGKKQLLAQKARDAQDKKEKQAKKEAWQRAQQILDYRQQSVAKDLSAKELEAIKDYTNERGKRSYTKLNGCLRKPLCLDLKARLHAIQLDGALRKLPKNTDGNEFYRGISVTDKKGEALLNFLAKAKPGTKLKDPGFGSYTSKKEVAEGFQEGTGGNKSIMFVSRSKSLRPLNSFSSIPEEYEALMPRGAVSVIRKVKVKGTTLIVEVD